MISESASESEENIYLHSGGRPGGKGKSGYVLSILGWYIAVSVG